MKKIFDIQRKFRFIVYVLLIVSISMVGVSSYIFALSIKMVELSK